MAKINLPEFSLAQLALRNGVDKEEVWVGFKGNIYDVSLSRLWRKGTHYEHWAGQDLTDELKDAPHTANVFLKFKIVGKIVVS
jgi:predicted heme/steroid binding protein